MTDTEKKYWVAFVALPLSAIFIYWLTPNGVAPIEKAPTEEGATLNRYATPEAKSIVRGLRKDPEASWLVWDSNTIIIGMPSRPEDAQGLANAWAMQLNRAWDFGAHVFIVPEDTGPTSNVSRYYVSATARYGELKR